MKKPIIVGLATKSTATVETNLLSNSCPNSVVQKQSCCPSSTTKLVKQINMEDVKNQTVAPSNSCPNLFVQKRSSCMKTVKSISFKEAKEQRRRKFPRTLEILFKKAAQSKKPPSWMVLRGKERRKSLKQIMQTLERREIINPYSVEQFESFKNALQEHGQEEMPTTCEEGNNGKFLDYQEVVLDLGGNYGNAEFDDFEGQYLFNINRGFCGGDYGNSDFDDSVYVSNKWMELSSVEEMLNGFIEEKLL